MQLNAITRKSALMAMILLVAILVAVALRSYIYPFGVEIANSEFAERPFALVVMVLLYICGGIVEGKIFPRSGLNKGYCTLPIPLYGLLACGIFVAPNGIATAAASLCFALAIFMLLRSLHSAGEKNSIFFASMLLGAMVLLEPACVVLVGVLPLALFILALSVRQIVLMVVGYLLPTLAASYLLWYKGDDFLQFWHNLSEALVMPQMDSMTEVPILAIVMMAAVAVVLIYGMIYAAISRDKMFLLTRTRHSLYLFVLLLFLTLSMLLIPSCDLSIFAIIAVPTAVLLSFVLGLLPNNQSTIAYWLLLFIFVLHLFVE